MEIEGKGKANITCC